MEEKKMLINKDYRMYSYVVKEKRKETHPQARFVLGSYMCVMLVFFFIFLFVSLITIAETECKVDQNRSKDKDTEHSGTKTIVIGAGQTLSDPISSPMEGSQGVDHDNHSDKGKDAGRDTSDPVAKVKQTNGE